MAFSFTRLTNDIILEFANENILKLDEYKMICPVLLIIKDVLKELRMFQKSFFGQCKSNVGRKIDVYNTTVQWKQNDYKDSWLEHLFI